MSMYSDARSTDGAYWKRKMQNRIGGAYQILHRSRICHSIDITSPFIFRGPNVYRSTSKRMCLLLWPFFVTGSKSQKCLRMNFCIVVLPLLGILQWFEIKISKDYCKHETVEAYALFDVCLIWQTPSFRDEQNHNLFWECKAENATALRTYTDYGQGPSTVFWV